MKIKNSIILLIYSKYKHHGPETGYKQLAKAFPDAIKLGVDYNKEEEEKKSHLKYLWLKEFEALKYKSKIDLLHIMYAEEYFRFSPQLFKNIPIVLTFHQPASVLAEYLKRGSGKGRIDDLTHHLTKNRFNKVDAAIVTEESQKEVLKKYMDESRISVIPLGIYTQKFEEARSKFELSNAKQKDQVLIVGNWLRDWNFLSLVLEHYEGSSHKFIIINRNFSDDMIPNYKRFKNLEIKRGISDEELKKQYFESKLHFLPLTEAAGNNALLEGLAMGCPSVMSGVVGPNFPFKGPALNFYTKNSLNEAIKMIDYIFALNEDEYSQMRKRASASIQKFDWAEIANKTKLIYEKVLKK